MKLGLNLGYWGLGNDADNLALAREADRLGYAVVWAAEAYGSDAATVLAWIAAQTEQIDVGSAIFQIPGRTPAMTRDDRGHARHAVRRPLPARARRLRAAGLRGLARRPVRQAARPHPRVRRDRPQGAAPRAGAVRRRVLHAAAAGRPRQGADPDRAPGPRRPSRSTSPRSARRTSSWPARSPTAGWRSSSRPSTPRSRWQHIEAGRAKAGPGRWTGFDVVPTVPVVIGDDLEPARRRCAPTRPSTSAAWAAARRTSTTRSPSGWATRRPPPRCRTSTWPATTPAPPRPCRSSSSTRPRSSGPAERIRDRLARLRRRRRHHPHRRHVRGLAGGADRHPAHHGRRARGQPGLRVVIGWFEAVVLGIVQGLTEFLPISSSAHLLIVSQLFGWEDPGAAFTAVTQIGTESGGDHLLPPRHLAHPHGVDAAPRRTRRCAPTPTRGWAGSSSSGPSRSACSGCSSQDQIETVARNLWLVGHAC